jgi:hypothetical protein
MVAGVPTNFARSFGFGCLCDVPVHGASGVTGWRTMPINVRIKVPSNARRETLAALYAIQALTTGYDGSCGLRNARLRLLPCTRAQLATHPQ